MPKPFPIDEALTNVADRIQAFAANVRVPENNSIHLRNIELLLAGPCRRPALAAGLRFEVTQLLGRDPKPSEMEWLLPTFPEDTTA